MTKVVVQSTVGKSFSFSDSKIKLTHSQNEPTRIVGDYNDLDENTILFNDKMAVDSEGSSENTICGSNTYDSEMTDTQMTVENSEDSSSRAVQKEIINKGFKYVSTKTTVINRTFNLIAQSALSCAKAIPTATENHINHESLLTNETDKSKVVVQILTSDARNSLKTQTITETKSAHVESPTSHSFRDDVFKIFSKPQATNLKLGINNHEEKQNKQQVKEISCEPNRSHSLQTKSTETTGYARKSQALNRSDLIPTNTENSKQIERSRRKRSLKSYFLFGRGPKISDIKHVPTCLQTATRNALRIVHYVLYDKYGLCSGEQQLLQTRKNILNFCGYPFSQRSPEFLKRANCLQKIPLPILFEVHAAIFGKTNVDSRMIMVQQLMQFFLKPKRYYKIVNKLKQNPKFIEEEEYHALKEAALKGPLPNVPLKKLEIDDIEKINNVIKAEMKPENSKVNVLNGKKWEEDESGSSSYCSPAYILKGPGLKLKHFPSILRNVKRASGKNISLLHYILYGRVESKSVEMCKRNILEFSGFLKCQTHFIEEREAILTSLEQGELLELCEILCLCAKTNSKNRRVQKILDYLKKPVNPVKGRRFKPKLGSNRSSELKYSFSDSIHVKESADSFLDDTEKMENVGSCRKLQDFKQIRSNIECSVPANLVELNDLLFMKPCDETEIHEKILTFSGFHFPTSSFHYHSRKTLMFYMGPTIVQKIAKLLDIEEAKQISSHEELSSSILKFLMGKKFQNSCMSSSSFKKSFDERQESQTKSLHESAVVKQTNGAIASRKARVFIRKLSDATVEKNLNGTHSNLLEPLNMQERINQLASSDMQERNYQLAQSNMEERANQLVLSNVEEGSNQIVLSNMQERNYQFAQSNMEERANQLVLSNMQERNKARVFIHKLSDASVEKNLNGTHSNLLEPLNMQERTNQLAPSDMKERNYQLAQSNMEERASQLVLSNVEERSNQIVLSNMQERNNQLVLSNVDERDDTMMYSEDCSDDSTPLRDFIHHPTDQELITLIHNIIKGNLFHITMGGLVQKVYKHYSQFNLAYRENFIKEEARQVLTDLRRKAVNVVQQMNNSVSNVQ